MTQHFPFLKKNLDALIQWEKNHPNDSIAEQIVDNPNDTIFELRTICGLCCALCGKSVTAGDFAWANCDAQVTCFKDTTHLREIKARRMANKFSVY